MGELLKFRMARRQGSEIGGHKPLLGRIEWNFLECRCGPISGLATVLGDGRRVASSHESESPTDPISLLTELLDGNARQGYLARATEPSVVGKPSSTPFATKVRNASRPMRKTFHV